MSFLKTLLRLAAKAGKTPSKAPKRATQQRVEKVKTVSVTASGTYSFHIAGESHCQAALARLAKVKAGDVADCRIVATLICEKNNPHDENAVVVQVGREKIGYLSRDDAQEHRECLEDTYDCLPKATVNATIMGGGLTSEGTVKMYGVLLDMDEIGAFD